MRYLLYCVLSSQENQESQTLMGVDGQPVFLIGNNGLNAAVSKIGHSGLTANMHMILAYEKVIESLHRDHTVIPVRYGCLFDEQFQIINLLEERCRRYQTILKELNGCVEMGIRILVSDCGPATRNPQPVTSGRAYLAARSAHYTQEERFTKEINMAIQRYRNAFAGLFVKCKTEGHAIRNPLISLYFLVPRGLVESFRRVFGQLSTKESPKLLLSGPWPAYNFIPGDQDVGQG